MTKFLAISTAAAFALLTACSGQSSETKAPAATAAAPAAAVKPASRPDSRTQPTMMIGIAVNRSVN